MKRTELSYQTFKWINLWQIYWKKNNCFLNVYLPDEDDLQIKIEGLAEVVDSGDLFKEIKNYEESENLPPKLKVNSIIIVKIVNVEETNG